MIGDLVAGAVVAAGAVVIWAHDLPAGSWVHRLARPVLRPARWLGLGHTWRLFAPRPSRGETGLTLEVVRAGGIVEEVAYPPSSLRRGRRGRPLVRSIKLRRALLTRPNDGLRRSFARFVIERDLGEGPPVVAVRYRVERRPPAPFDDRDRRMPLRRTRRPFSLRIERPS